MTMTDVAADECIHELPLGSCTICLHPERLLRPATLPRTPYPGTDGDSTPYEVWKARRAARAAAGELPPGHDDTDPKSAWNAYNNYGHVDSLELALVYVRERGGSSHVALACALTQDDLGRPVDWL